MRHAAARIGAGAVLLIAVGYTTQVDDSRRPPSSRSGSQEVVESPTGQLANAGREHVIAHYLIVPVGAASVRLPILMYHYIRRPPSAHVDALGFRLSVSPAVFDAQMSWLASHGYHPINFNQLRAYFARKAPLPARPVVITLDDGYRDLYTTAFPILRAHDFTAVAYIVSGFVDWPGYVTSDEVIQLDREGIEIASHTVDHADLSRMGFASMMFEVVQSKRWLEKLLCHAVLDFAYPSGRFNSETIEAVEKAGYDSAVTTSDYPILHSLFNRFVWSRVRVSGGESLHGFVVGLGSSMRPAVATRIEVEMSPFDLQQRT